MSKTVSRSGNWRRNCRITFNTTQPIKDELEAAAAEGGGIVTVSDVVHELAPNFAVDRVSTPLPVGLFSAERRLAGKS
jgi:hypothetical protein